MAGPEVRSDLIDVYVFRRRPGAPPPGVEFLQLRRAPGAFQPGVWQPVMGVVRGDEVSAQAALRELYLHTGFAVPRDVVGFWHLEQPNTYFLHTRACIMLSPCFAAEVRDGVEPHPTDEHDQSRWAPMDQTLTSFIWPGQRLAVEQISRDILDPASPVEARLRIDPTQV